MLFLPEEKRQHIMQDCRRALSQEVVSVRTLARMIGRKTATAQAIAPAPLHYRKLQKAKNKAFKHTQSFESTVRLDNEAREELQWWLEEMENWNGKTILPQAPDMVIDTDASLLEWGACMKGTATGGLVGEREVSPYQSTGTKRCCLCSKELHERKEQYPREVQDGQHNRDCVHQSHGRYKVSKLSTMCSALVAIVSTKEDHHLSRAPTGGEQCHRRSGVLNT